MRPRVAVLHHPRSFFPLDLAREVGDAADLIWVVSDSSQLDPGMSRILPRLGAVVDVTGLSPDDACSALSKQRPDGIVTFVDDLVEAAAGLALPLGLRYHTPAVATSLVDKRRQREVLHTAGVPSPRFWSIPDGSSPEQVRSIGQEISFPAVVKPARGSGSRGIQRLHSVEHLLATTADAEGYIIEEYLDDAAAHGFEASYFSVESVVSAGRVSHVATTGRFPLAEPFRETGNFVPAILDPALHPQVLAMVTDALKALGVTDAVTHTEIKLTPGGPKLVEVNGRLGGRPPFVLGAVSSVNLFQVACAVSVGASVALPKPAECDGVAYWLMIQPPMDAHAVAQIQGLEAVSALPGVDSVVVSRGAGSVVDWREGTGSSVLTVRGRVSHHDDLRKTVAEVNRILRVDYVN